MIDSEGALPPREEGFEEQHPTSKRARLEDEPEAAAEAAFEQSSDEDSITSKGNGDESNTDKGSGDEGSVVEVNELKLKPSQYGANTPTPTQGRSSSFQLTGVWQALKRIKGEKLKVFPKGRKLAVTWGGHHRPAEYGVGLKLGEPGR